MIEFLLGVIVIELAVLVLQRSEAWKETVDKVRKFTILKRRPFLKL